VHYIRLGELNETRTGSVELGSDYRSVPETDTPRHSWPYFRATFMDNTNIFWLRDSLGRLTETSDGFPPTQTREYTLAELRARQLNSQLPAYPSFVSSLIPATQVWRKGGTVDWKRRTNVSNSSVARETSH
jgi:hypothetical protein